MVATLRLVPAALVLLIAACGGGGAGNGGGNQPPACTDGTDLDGDGYGEGCPAGADCNDGDSAVWDDCCAAGPATGCACDPATDETVPCFEGPADAPGNGECRKGTRSCDPTTSTWGACGGQVLPGSEICDTADNDCDGDVDEAVQSACGNCLPGCDGAGVDTDPFPLPPADPSVDADGVGLDQNGDLVLDSTTVVNHFLWIANDKEGTVSKIDTRTGREVARYPSVTHAAIIDHTGGRPVAAYNGDVNGNAYADNRPSRTAIDFKGDVWVANRAHDGGSSQPSVTKIFNLEDDCIDRNGNGQIDTSRDLDGNGVITVGSGEFLAEADECVAFTVVVGADGGIARAVAIDQGIEPGDPGNAWVGMFGEQAFYQINGKTGALMQRVPATGALGIAPYGATIGSDGLLWAPSGCCGAATLRSINTAMNPAAIGAPVTLTGVNGSYGIVVDSANRVWVGAWPEAAVKRYDPATGSVLDVPIPDAYGQGWGVRGVGIDTHGNVWAAIHRVDPFNDGRVARIVAATATASGWWDIGGEVPVGVGVDFDGDVWTVNQTTSNASRLHIDQGTLQPGAHPMTGNVLDQFPVGPNPYTYSDFTGLGLRTVTRPTGEYAVPIQGCENLAAATWLGIEFDATVPASTSLELWVRSGNDLATLDDQPIHGPWTISPADLQAPPGPVPAGAYLKVIFRLQSEDGEATPILHGYEVQWSCPGEPVD